MAVVSGVNARFSKDGGSMPKGVATPIVMCCALWIAACTEKPPVTPRFANVRPVQTDSVFRNAVREATFVFVGTILYRNAVVDSLIPASPRTSIVRADSVLRGPAGAGNFRGQRLTLVSDDSSGLSDSLRAVFFAYGLIAGRSFVVREVLRLTASTADTVSFVGGAVEQALQADDSTELKERADSADAVAVGVVLSTTSIQGVDSLRLRYRGEHAPVWSEARIRVTRLFKGDPAMLHAPWRVLFPRFAGLPADRAPALSPGQNLVYFLTKAGRFSNRMLAGIDTTNRFAVYEEQDVLQASDTMRVRRVLR
jgi:hypothetical protein